MLGELYTRYKRKQQASVGLPVKDLTLMSQLKTQIEKTIQDQNRRSLSMESNNR